MRYINIITGAIVSMDEKFGEEKEIKIVLIY